MLFDACLECFPAGGSGAEGKMREPLVEKIIRRDGADEFFVGTDGAVRFPRQRLCRNGDPDSAFPQLLEIAVHIGDDCIASPLAGAFLQMGGIGGDDIPGMGAGIVDDSAVQSRIIEIQKQKDAFAWILHAVM